MQVSDREIEIINDALVVELGQNPIHDLEGQSPASKVARRAYPQVMAYLLGSYSWRFAMMTVQLTRAGSDPEIKWQYAHRLPADRASTPVRYYRDTRGQEFGQWEIIGDEVRSDEKVLYCDYVKSGGLTGVFRELLVTALAAKMAWPLTRDKGLADRLKIAAYGDPRDNMRGGLWQSAVSQESKGGDPRAVATIGQGPLVRAFWS